MKALFGAPDLLPTLIRQAADHVVTVTNKSTEKTRLGWIQKIIDVIVTHCDDAHCLAVAPTSLKAKNNLADAVDVTVRAIAMYLRKKTLIAQLIERKVNPWGKTHLFGHVLCIAAILNDMKSANLLLAGAAAITVSITKSRRSDITIEALNAAILRKHWPFAVSLLNWHASNNVRTLTARFRQELLETAAATDGLPLLRNLPVRDTEDQRKLLLGLLRNPAPKAVLQFCVKERIKDWMQVRRSGEDKARPLLDLAVREDNLPLVEAVVHVQDHVPDAELYSAGLIMPYREAICRNQVAMVRLFLQQGVDPEAPINPYMVPGSARPPTSTCELARPGSEVYAIVRKAVENKIATHGEHYRKPHYYVWSEKQQRDVGVAYTFHPPKF